MEEKVVIMGAAGRDFHNFNVCFRDNPRYRVIAFTGTQIPDIAGRVYPAELAGKAYPQGIPIFPEEELERLIKEQGAELVVFSYSDIAHIEVMHRASLATATGASFLLLSSQSTMLPSRRPVISVCAVRTGCGKSPTTRHICRILQSLGKKPVVVRHPMPYGDLASQAVQRFGDQRDLDRHHCTIEEREEYQPLVEIGIPVFAGIDYGRILRQAEEEADVIIWDGGNNDTPFFRPDIAIVLVDPHRPGHETGYHPGETNLLMADLAIITKVDSASRQQVEQTRENIARLRPAARILLAESQVTLEKPESIRNRRVLVVEDGPTLTHGGMPYGAGVVAARRHGAGEIVDPRPFAAGSIVETFRQWPHLQTVLPAMGYSRQQVSDLERTINAVDCDIVLFATPANLPAMISVDKPALRVRYEYRDHGHPTLEEALLPRLGRLLKRTSP